MSWSNGKGRGIKYGSAHQKARREWAARHQPWHRCFRCGAPLGAMGPHLHLDHAEDGGYLGFSHARCNVRAGSRKGARIRNGVRATPRARGPVTPLQW